MIFIALSIISTTLIILLFKVFENQKVNTLQAIVINYFVGSSVGLIISPTTFFVYEIIAKPWFHIAALTGILFITTFYLMAITVQKVGVSAATVASKMSLIIPVGVAFYFYGDNITSQKILGILLAIVAVVFASLKTEKQHVSIQKLGLPLTVFMLSGLVDSSINFAQKKLLQANEFELFFSVIMFFAASVGVVLILINASKQKISIQKNSIIGGIALGALNIYSLIFLIKALDSGVMQASVLFPLNNVSVLLFSSLTSILFFKEKLSKLNWLGLLLSLVAIGLLMQ